MNPVSYERRGKQTFIILLVMRLMPAFLFLFAILILASLKSGILHSLQAKPGPLSPTLIQVFSLLLSSGLLLFFIFCIASVIAAWLQYISFEYAFDDAAFKTRRGIFDLTEMSIPYRQIQNIDIERPLLYRLLGMSRLIILTASHEDADDPEHDDSKSTLDLIDTQKALKLQHELLERSTLQAARILHPVDPTDVHKY